MTLGHAHSSKTWDLTRYCLRVCLTPTFRHSKLILHVFPISHRAQEVLTNDDRVRVLATARCVRMKRQDLVDFVGRDK